MATPTTLPATFVSGAVLTAAQMNDLRGAFRVLQVVVAQTTTSTTSSTDSYIATTLIGTITPTSTSSRILITVTHSNCFKSSANAANRMDMQLFKNGLYFATIATNMAYDGLANEGAFPIVYQTVDSPNTVSAVTYDTGFRNPNNTAEVAVQRFSTASTICLMEIST